MLFLRIMTGIIFFYAGTGKAFGFFGGYGIKATLEAYRSYSHIGPFWAYLNIYAEVIGSVLLILGLFTRPAAFVLMINMLVAVFVVGFKDFFGQNGAAYVCTLMVTQLVIFLIGPGQYSIDAAMTKNKN
jgi:putative oxidoreductase